MSTKAKVSGTTLNEDLSVSGVSSQRNIKRKQHSLYA